MRPRGGDFSAPPTLRAGSGRNDARAAPPRPEETLFEAVAETVFRQYERLWKPATLDVDRGYLENQLPHFAGRPVPEIDACAVRVEGLADGSTVCVPSRRRQGDSQRTLPGSSR